VLRPSAEEAHAIQPPDTIRGRRVLVTGGSGTVGAHLVRQLLASEADVVRILGRDETKQFYQRQQLGGRREVRFLVGDIRDRDRLLRATEDIDVVFHCAALKHVESGEYNPFEVTQTNVAGTQNVIDACLANDVETMVLTSSDKAANPTSVMGASKLLAEKLVTAATNYRGTHKTVFASVRFGNVLGSRGSALELFARQVADGGPVTVTDPSMTRFVMTTERAVELAIRAAGVARGGEVFVFKMPVARVGDLVAAAIEVAAPLNGRDAASIRTRSIDPRPGEKPYEELMTEEESTRARDIGEMFAVLPAIEAHEDVVDAYRDASPAPVGAYRSDRVDPLAPDEVTSLVAEAFAAERRVGTMSETAAGGVSAAGFATGEAAASRAAARGGVEAG
jgi:UDP-N-acetylglucosamine 4,6-dehydratase